MKGITLKESKKLKTKTVYTVCLEGVDTNFIALERFKNGVTKRYPFNLRDEKIVQKYDTIKCLTTTENKRPSSGFSISESRGFGFTNPKGVASLFYYLQKKNPKIQEVVFITKGQTEIKGKKLFLTLKDFAKIEKQTGSFVERKKKEGENLYQNVLSKVLPKQFKAPKTKTYVSGSLANYINSHSNFKLSEDDRTKLKDLFINSGLSTDSIISTKTELDIIYYEDVIDEFKKILKQKTYSKALEEKWHQFFKRHSWIFSQIFSFPAVFLKDKMNVGGQNIEGDTNKIVDFLYKNNITNNIAFIEIKTHLADLIGKSAYRKPDIYAVSTQLTGGIVQVLDQKNKLLKNFHSKVGNVANSLNSVCVVIAGNTGDFNKKGQRESFELFRWSNKDVIIIPFDELLEKIEFVLNLFKKDG